MHRSTTSPSPSPSHATTPRVRAAALTLALLPCVAAADDPAPGFGLVQEPYPGGGLTATTDAGDVVTFDGQVVALYDAAGTHVTDLATLPAFAFGSFLVLAPDETYAVLGESSNGTLWRVDLVAGGAAPLTTLAFNYDGAFEAQERLLVSAATCGFGCGNELYRVDAATGATTLVATVGGASGPLVVEPDGDVVYGRVSDTFSLGDHRVLRFDAADLAGGTVATEADAGIVGLGFDGAADLALDPRNGDLFLVENDFASGLNRIRWVRGDAAVSPVLFDGTNGRTLSNLELEPGGDEALLRAFQPGSGGRLRFHSSDFVSVALRQHVEPARPSLSLSGPGASGPGPLTLTVAGGAPQGFFALLVGPSATFDPDETALHLGALDAPLFFGLAPSTLVVDPVLTTLDVGGLGQRTVPHDGSLLGLVTGQALVLDAAGKLVQVSSAAAL